MLETVALEVNAGAWWRAYRDGDAGKSAALFRSDDERGSQYARMPTSYGQR